MDSNIPKPLRQQFDRQVKRIQEDVLRMGALVESSFLLAHQALFERDLAAASEIAPQDKKIDQLYHQIELDCVTLITLQAPVSRDLRLLSTLMQLVRDLERIGDYAKDLGEIAVRLFQYTTPDCMGRVEEMSGRCQEMLAMSMSALTELDAESGLQVKTYDDAVDDDYEFLYNLLSSQTDIKGPIEPILLLVLVIRHLERMADHATNIGQRVAYVVTGQRK
jgi:phosphate transport system protein